MPRTSTARRIRKDAQHNRSHILDVARAAFTSAGVDVSMDAIATQAGVGPGTLYRHFPNKDALLAALLDAHHDDLERQRTMIEAQETRPDRILERWMDALGDWMLVYDGLSEPLRQGWSRTNSPLSPTCSNVIDTTNRILSAAQTGGTVRPGLTGRDIFLGALAVAWAGGTSAADANTRHILREMLKTGWRQPG
ncbi:helix-turn-helix domain-containing protein [Sphingobium sp. CR2-8]|uniref:TetR/AcrR family transcriptional regulator n=1 Tax=Sphingobium sp. CR2-8 TaxID=1306534 RepID=UPI002DB76302|nr:helix-turn-helix domain-containing protein [Sphingobium sp. CR2-8]MEC3909138.1 helix-turn-helix domain-containing protein [Sphingobium sp. CR2-8]